MWSCITMYTHYTVQSSKSCFTCYWFLRARSVVVVWLWAGFPKPNSTMSWNIIYTLQRKQRWKKEGGCHGVVAACSCRWGTGLKKKNQSLGSWRTGCSEPASAKGLLWPLWITITSLPQLKQDVKQAYFFCLDCMFWDSFWLGLLINTVWGLKQPPSQAALKDNNCSHAGDKIASCKERSFGVFCLCSPKVRVWQKDGNTNFSASWLT